MCMSCRCCCAPRRPCARQMSSIASIAFDMLRIAPGTRLLARVARRIAQRHKRAGSCLPTGILRPLSVASLPLIAARHPMRGSRALAALLRRTAAASQQPPLQHPLQPLGALKQLQRGLASSGRFSEAGGGAATAAAAGGARWVAAVAAGLSAGVGVQLYSGGDPAQCKAAAAAAAAAADQPSDAKSRLIDKEEVAKHCTKETGGSSVAPRGGPVGCVPANQAGRQALQQAPRGIPASPAPHPHAPPALTTPHKVPPQTTHPLLQASG